MLSKNKKAALSVSFFWLKMPSYQTECQINEENPFEHKMQISSELKTKWTNKSNLHRLSIILQNY